MENWNWRHGIPLFQIEMDGIKVVVGGGSW